VSSVNFHNSGDNGRYFMLGGATADLVNQVFGLSNSWANGITVKVLVKYGTGSKKWCGDIKLWESLITYSGIYGRCEPTGDGDRWWAIGDTIELATTCDFVAYEKVTDTYCKAASDSYGNYNSVSAAQAACEADSNCLAVYDENCDNDEYRLCPPSTFLTSSSVGSCVYPKILF